MGYYITIIDSTVFIAEENLDALFITLKALRPSGWVSSQDIGDATNVTDLFKAWRWEPEYDENGNIKQLNFDGEKLGSEEELFDAIAPYVRDWSHIEAQGEEYDARWRWVFRDGFVREEGCKTIWPYEEEEEEERRARATADD